MKTIIELLVCKKEIFLSSMTMFFVLPSLAQEISFEMAFIHANLVEKAVVKKVMIDSQNGNDTSVFEIHYFDPDYFYLRLLRKEANFNQDGNPQEVWSYTYDSDENKCEKYEYSGRQFVLMAGDREKLSKRIYYQETCSNAEKMIELIYLDQSKKTYKFEYYSFCLKKEIKVYENGTLKEVLLFEYKHQNR